MAKKSKSSQEKKKEQKGRIVTNLSRIEITLAEMEEIGRIPLGIAPFDVCSGGGIPLGTITLFSGPQGSGKSTMVSRAIGGFNRLYPDKKAAYVNAENKLDPYWVGVHGGNPKKIHVFSPEFAEQAQYQVREIALRRPDVGLIVVDSLSSLSPEIELDPDNVNVTNQQMGIAAKLNNAFMRALTSIQLQRYNTGNPLTVVIINQERSAMDAYMPPILPGGKGQQYHCAMWCRLLSAENNFDKSNGIPISTTFRWIFIKNMGQASRWTGEAEMYTTPVKNHLPGYFADQEFTWMWAAQRFGILKNRGANGFEMNDVRRMKEEWLDLWENDPGVYEATRAQVVEQFRAWTRGNAKLMLKAEAREEKEVAHEEASQTDTEPVGESGAILG